MFKVEFKFYEMEKNLEIPDHYKNKFVRILSKYLVESHHSDKVLRDSIDEKKIYTNGSDTIDQILRAANEFNASNAGHVCVIVDYYDARITVV